MSIFAVSLLLAQQQTTVPNPTAQKIQFFGMLAIFGVMFYLLMIRPQQKRASEHEKLLKALKPGDKVVAAGGVVGVVVSIKDKSVTLRSADTKLEVLKSAVSEVSERSGESTESAS